MLNVYKKKDFYVGSLFSDTGYHQLRRQCGQARDSLQKVKGSVYGIKDVITV